MAIPRYRDYAGPVLFSAGFRPFFLLAGAWAALAVPLWLLAYAGGADLPGVLPAQVWHAHEMVFGYAAAVVAGFMLTAIPNWTGRMPLQGGALGLLVGLWLLGRVALLASAQIGPIAAAVLDLAFPVAFLAAVAREIVAGGNWRNLPMLVALAALLAGNALVHVEALGLAPTAELGDRLGIATLVLLISLIGGRIVPSFTRNWLVKQDAEAAAPANFGRADRVALVLTAAAVIAWTAAPEAAVAGWLELAAGLAAVVRLARWRGGATWREPLLLALHLGYLWVAAGLLLLGANTLRPLLPATTALHALTVGGIGTMTLAVMTRATLGHTGRKLVAGPVTTTIYALVTLAALARLLAPFAGADYLALLTLAGAAWSGAFGAFVVAYLPPLTRPRAADAKPI